MKDSKNIQKTGGEQGKITACFCRFAEKNIHTSYVLIKQGAGNIKIVTTHIHQEEFIMSDFVASPERLITGALLGFAVL